MNPKSQVLSAIVASGLVITADGVLGGEKLTFTRYTSLTFIAIMLVIFASFAPELAAGFAWLIFAAVLITKGQRVFSALKF